MKVKTAGAAHVMGRRVGPSCIACGNTRTFWVVLGGETILTGVTDLGEGEYEVVGCGRCGSRHSLIITHVD